MMQVGSKLYTAFLTHPYTMHTHELFPFEVRTFITVQKIRKVRYLKLWDKRGRRKYS